LHHLLDLLESRRATAQVRRAPRPKLDRFPGFREFHLRPVARFADLAGPAGRSARRLSVALTFGACLLAIGAAGVLALAGLATLLLLLLLVATLLLLVALLLLLLLVAALLLLLLVAGLLLAAASCRPCCCCCCFLSPFCCCFLSAAFFVALATFCRACWLAFDAGDSLLQLLTLLLVQVLGSARSRARAPLAFRGKLLVEPGPREFILERLLLVGQSLERLRHLLERLGRRRLLGVGHLAGPAPSAQDPRAAASRSRSRPSQDPPRTSQSGPSCFSRPGEVALQRLVAHRLVALLRARRGDSGSSLMRLDGLAARVLALRLAANLRLGVLGKLRQRIAQRLPEAPSCSQVLP
jgi:hypothetical protein